MSPLPAFLAGLPLRSRAAARGRAPVCVATTPRPPPAIASAGGAAGGAAPRRRGNGGRGSRAARPAGAAGGAAGGARVVRAQKAAKEAPAVRRDRLLAEVEAARGAAAEARKAARKGGRSVGSVSVGERIRGRVRNLVRHGAYVDVGCVRDGLVHIRDMSVDFVYDPSDVVSDGAEVDVWVKYVDAVKGVIGLTMVPPAGAVGFSGRVKVGEVNIGGRYEGVVARVTNYGAYVDIGAERHGFVHVSALWGRRPRETLEDLRLGRRIWVHVDEVDEVRSFVRLRARGKRGGEELSEHAEVGDAVEDLLDVGLGAEDGAPRAVPPVTEEIVLQRFGAELAGGDEEDEDEDEDEDGDEDGDEDYDEDEDDDDEYEMDFEHQVAARFQPPPEAAYGTLADYDDGGKDVDVDDDEDSEENNFGETWSDPTEHTARGVYL